MVKDTIALSLRATPAARMAQKAAQAAPLGTYGKSSSTQPTPAFDAEQLLRSRYALRDGARRLMPDEAVARCGRHIAPLSGGVSVLYSPSTKAAHFGGLEACHSVWMCPCCAAKITERRRLELAIALRQAREQKMRVVMCTFTFSHHRGEVLRDMLSSMRRAWKLYTGGRRANQLYKQFGVVGFVRALEVTYGSNGWHPHMHQLVFLPEGVDAEAFERQARGMWEDAAAAAGLVMNEHGFQLDDCDEKVGAYITKFGRDPSEATKKAWEQGWNETNELTKWQTKLGRSTCLGDDEHVTPMQLLRFAVMGDEHAAALFQEYANAFKGQRQLYWSPGLKQLFSIEDMTDQEVAEQQVADAEKLAFLYAEEWRCVLGNDARVELLLVARQGDAQLVAEFLYELGLERFASSSFSRNSCSNSVCELYI